MKVAKILLAAFCFCVLSGCAYVSGSMILTGTARDAIDPNDVKIYLDPPENYETVGLVEASGEVTTTRQDTQDKVILELKKQAAKVGANGILLVDTNSAIVNGGSGGSLGGLGGGFGFSTGTSRATSDGFTSSGVSLGFGTGGGGGSDKSQVLSAKARAIYIAEEPTEETPTP